MRDLWVTAASLTTAPNTAFLAERIALFSIVMGVALLLTGIGFLVLTIAVCARESATGPTPQAAERRVVWPVEDGHADPRRIGAGAGRFRERHAE